VQPVEHVVPDVIGDDRGGWADHAYGVAGSTSLRDRVPAVPPWFRERPRPVL
jgi:hypothetical protein